MRKGERTREAILDHAVGLASKVGLEGLSIGALAADLGLSKSGLFAHFGSKEALQLRVLESAVDRFIATVLAPALRAPRGEPRLR
ncbi:MAG: helix-turn-helix domain-containing protein, partial [Alphaproteobacteria bacterium]